MYILGTLTSHLLNVLRHSFIVSSSPITCQMCYVTHSQSVFHQSHVKCATSLIHSQYFTNHMSNVLRHSFTVSSSPSSSTVSSQSRGSLPPTAPSRRLCVACSRICCSKTGCSRSSSADGRSSGSGWRHRVRRS